LVEVNAETDFVARNEQFQEFVKTTAGLALESAGDLNALKAAAYPGTERTVEEQLTHLIAIIGENMSLRRVQVIEVGQGVIASYVHNSLASGLGRIGVLTALESEADATTLDALGKQISMHVAAVKPLAVSRDGLDPAEVEGEREILAQQARETGKPEEIIEKMVEGRMRKYFEEVCLLDQTFVIDGETKVENVLEEASKESGAVISVSAFGLFVLGQGIEKKKENLAAEVAAAIGD